MQMNFGRDGAEFLRTLQERKTCKTRKRNFRNGDIVLLKAETHRNHWPVACIIETLADKHGVGEQSD